MKWKFVIRIYHNIRIQVPLQNLDVVVGEDPEVDLSGAGQSLHSAGGACLRFWDRFGQC